MRNWDSVPESGCSVSGQGPSTATGAGRVRLQPRRGFARELRFLRCPASMAPPRAAAFSRELAESRDCRLFVVRKAHGRPCSLEGFGSTLVLRLSRHFSGVEDLIP